MLRVFLAGCVALLMIAAQPALAEERILSFDSLVEVQPDGDFLVTETIRLRAEGDQISRGIYRDFPIVARDGLRNLRLGFTLIAAERDGQPEMSRIIEGARAIRIYLGDPKQLISTGEHVYRLTYRTDRQLRRFPGHDEVYWSATGTEWLFPIDQASATVRLPEGARIDDLAAYTGAFGETGTDADWQQIDARSATFRTTRPLEPREGLTVALRFQAGLIPPPDRARRIDWLWRDHGPALWGLAGLLGLGLAYLALWWGFGRDPRADITVPRWEPPAGLSAALTRATWREMRPEGDEALSLTLVEMASRGFISVTREGKAMVLARLGQELSSDLPPEQRLVIAALDRAGGVLRLDLKNGREIVSLRDGVRDSLRAQYKALGSYRRAGFAVFLGLSLTLVLMILIPLQLPPRLDGLMIAFGLLALLAAVLLRLVVARRKGRETARTVGFFGLFMLSPFLGLVVLGYFKQGGDLLMPLALAGMVLVSMVFLPILGGPTPAGRKRLDEIAGLRDYIAIAEEDRLRLADAPPPSRLHFERILPFAMALDQEQLWVDRFRDWLAVGDAPVAGSTLGRVRMEDEIGSLSRLYEGGASSGGVPSVERQLADSLTSSLPVSSSRSSGFSSGSSSSSSRSSGGSSGGGGGGGGGGGW